MPKQQIRMSMLDQMSEANGMGIMVDHEALHPRVSDIAREILTLD